MSPPVRRSGGADSPGVRVPRKGKAVPHDASGPRHPSRHGPSGHGPGHRLLLVLLITGLGTLLVRMGPGLVQHRIVGTIDAPRCSAVIHRWAARQLLAERLRLESRHALYRSQGNAITAAMKWIDDRIIDQRIGDMRRQLSAKVLQFAGCVLRFSD
jgi:hypothetical protein